VARKHAFGVDPEVAQAAVGGLGPGPGVDPDRLAPNEPGLVAQVVLLERGHAVKNLTVEFRQGFGDERLFHA